MVGEPQDRPGGAPERLRVCLYCPFGVCFGAGASGAGWATGYVGRPFRHGRGFRTASYLEPFHGVFDGIRRAGSNLRYTRGGLPPENDRLLRLVRYQLHLPEQLSDRYHKLLSGHLDAGQVSGWELAATILLEWIVEWKQ